MSDKADPDGFPRDFEAHRLSTQEAVSLTDDSIIQMVPSEKTDPAAPLETSSEAVPLPTKAPLSFEHVYALDVVRIALTFWIVLYHQSQYDYYIESNPIGYLRFGFFGVELFYALSGFVLTFVYMDRFKVNSLREFGIAYAKFVLNRVARMWPLQAFFAALFYHLGECGFMNMVRDMLFGLAFYNPEDRFCCDPPAWFLHYEMYLSVLLPFVLVALNKTRLTILPLAGLAYYQLQAYLTNAIPADWDAGFNIQVLTCRAPTPFIMGVVVGWVYWTWRRQHFVFDILSAVCLYYFHNHMMGVFTIFDSFFYLRALLLFPTLIYLLSKAKLINRISNNVIVRSLSEYSMGVFLSHWLIVMTYGVEVGAIFPTSSTYHMLFVYVKYLLALHMGIACFYLIENPAVKLSRILIAKIGAQKLNRKGAGWNKLEQSG
jgi:peptidoglycan/LPS O-acetylase OafA/YrhL